MNNSLLNIKDIQIISDLEKYYIAENVTNSLANATEQYNFHKFFIQIHLYIFKSHVNILVENIDEYVYDKMNLLITKLQEVPVSEHEKNRFVLTFLIPLYNTITVKELLELNRRESDELLRTLIVSKRIQHLLKYLNMGFKQFSENVKKVKNLSQDKKDFYEVFLQKYRNVLSTIYNNLEIEIRDQFNIVNAYL